MKRSWETRLPPSKKTPQQEQTFLPSSESFLMIMLFSSLAMVVVWFGRRAVVGVETWMSWGLSSVSCV